jgi:spoIIIJ-associated protein
VSTEGEALVLEASGETVGEAKWLALRELEKLEPGFDRDAVEFEVLSEGERGLLGVGRSPARVMARVTSHAAAEPRSSTSRSEQAAAVQELLERIAGESRVHCRVQVDEDDESVSATFVGGDLGLLIGKHGQTIDAIQYLATAIAHRAFEDAAKPVTVDAAGYRRRRSDRLQALARRTAEEVVAGGTPLELEPMSAVERKLIHTYLQEVPGVQTRSEGEEPNRRVVVEPAPRE